MIQDSLKRAKHAYERLPHLNGPGEIDLTPLACIHDITINLPSILKLVPIVLNQFIRKAGGSRCGNGSETDTTAQGPICHWILLQYRLFETLP